MTEMNSPTKPVMIELIKVSKNYPPDVKALVGHIAHSWNGRDVFPYRYERCRQNYAFKAHM